MTDEERARRYALRQEEFDRVARLICESDEGRARKIVQDCDEALVSAIAAALAAERKRCARVCEERYIGWPQVDASLKDVALGCAAAIRALGENE